MSAAFDLICVGGGVMGSATAYAAARRGMKVLLLERFQIGHARGSSHGDSRIFRFSYPDEMYVRMAQEALPLWRALEGECGVDLLVRTGGLDVGEGVERNLAALHACGAEAELISPAEVASRWPGVRVRQDVPVMFSPDGAFVRADLAWRAFVDGACSRGTLLREECEVSSVELEGVVRLESGEVHEAPAVVVTAGAWATGLLRPAGVTIETRPTRETVAYFEGPSVHLPAVVQWDDPTVYALASPGRGLKVGEHIAGPEADPNESGAPDVESVGRVTAWVEQTFPDVRPEPIHAETCFYTNTSDESFILERHGNVIVGSPCSGHGFKFAPLIGERLVDLAHSARD